MVSGIHRGTARVIDQGRTFPVDAGHDNLSAVSLATVPRISTNSGLSS